LLNILLANAFFNTPLSVNIEWIRIEEIILLGGNLLLLLERRNKLNETTRVI
jgi:hypothetical protein